jgi:hypothetical protein
MACSTVTTNTSEGRARVTDAATGKPIEGALVLGTRGTYYAHRGASSRGVCDMEHKTQTDQNGEFVIPVEKTARYVNLNPFAMYLGSGYYVGVYKKGMREVLLKNLTRPPAKLPYEYEVVLEVDTRSPRERYEDLKPH